MEKSKNKFTIKIVFSYLLLLVLAGIATYYVYSEIGTYITKEETERSDSKLLKTSSLITQLYEAESLSKLALQSKEKKAFDTYILKIDSTYKDIEQLKSFTTSDYQKKLLDSLQILLERKVANNKVLRRLKTRDQTDLAINKALTEFDQLEESLGVITPEGIAPNIKDLSPKAQEVIRDLAKYLNQNVPKDSEEEKELKADSVLQASKALLREVQKENRLNENSLALREIAINKTDVELSQQLRSILSSFEQEILKNTINENIKKETALKRSVRLAIIAALLGFIVVGIFIFILNRDFWKASMYRQKLEKEKKYSEGLLKSREQLIGTVSHDLRTPLNAITGYTNLLEDSDITQSQGQHLVHIKSATDYVNNLVNDLLDFSQLEAGRMNPEKTPFSLYHLLYETVEGFRTTQENGTVQTKIQIDDALKKPIISDPLRIRQIVSNLLGNAYKFTNKGEVRLEAHLIKNNGAVKIVVSDTGIGIPIDEQQHIFNEFTQIKDKDLKKYGGYGLGLTISKKLTELLGGSIGLKSEVAKGSRFTLELPIIFSAEEIIKEKKEDYNFSGKPLRVVVIDDDTSFLHMLGEMMKRENLRTYLFSDFNQLEKNSEINYDIILTDIEMPYVTGFDVLQKLHNKDYEHYKGQPIIAMTGRRDMSKDFFVQKGFSGVLKKPFAKNEIFRLMAELTENVKVVNNLKVKNNEGQKNDKMYDLISLKTFLGNDQKAIQEILSTFEQNTINNQKEIHTAFKNNDKKQLGKTAHRMLPMFRQLQIASCIQILEKFENGDDGEFIAQELKKEYKILEKRLQILISQLHTELN